MTDGRARAKPCVGPVPRLFIHERCGPLIETLPAPLDEPNQSQRLQPGRSGPFEVVLTKEREATLRMTGDPIR